MIAAWLDAQPEHDARAALVRCCGSARWVDGMLALRPFGDDANLFAVAERMWAEATPDDVREALAHHPEIGADVDELRRRYSDTARWASGEQAGVRTAGEATLLALRDGNIAYKQRFGHVFVVCATGKGAAEMLTLLHARMANDPEAELAVAAAEQGKITRLRLEKLIA